MIRRSLEGTPNADRDLGVWVGYHPPLAYVVAAPVVWAAAEIGPDTWPALALAS